MRATTSASTPTFHENVGAGTTQVAAGDGAGVLAAVAGAGAGAGAALVGAAALGFAPFAFALRCRRGASGAEPSGTGSSENVTIAVSAVATAAARG